MQTTILKRTNVRCNPTPHRFRSMIACKARPSDPTYGPNDDTNKDRQPPNVWEKRFEAAIHRAKVRHLDKIYRSNVDVSPSLIKKLLRDKWGQKAAVRLTKKDVLGLEINFDDVGSQGLVGIGEIGEICEYINRNDLGYYIKKTIEASSSDSELPIWIPLELDAD